MRHCGVLRLLCSVQILNHETLDSSFQSGDVCRHLVFGLSLPAHAQMTGYTAELDTMFLEMEDGNVLAGIEYYGVYDVYANFTNPEDVLGAVYSDVVALGTPPMGIDAPCGCHNPAATSIVVDASNNPAFFAAFPDYEYDSFWTIGMEPSDEGRTIASQHWDGCARGFVFGHDH